MPGMRAIAPIPIAVFVIFVPGVTETTKLSGAGCGQWGTAPDSAEPSCVDPGIDQEMIITAGEGGRMSKISGMGA